MRMPLFWPEVLGQSLLRFLTQVTDSFPTDLLMSQTSPDHDNQCKIKMCKLKQWDMSGESLSEVKGKQEVCVCHVSQESDAAAYLQYTHTVW